ncbi:MAG: exosortase [Pseudomonadota bacterium]|jgi:exosortase|nr:exosortase [Pseudomonadota bacterium]
MGIIVGYAGPIWRTSRRGWLLPIIMGVSIGFTFYDGIEAIIRQWHASEEYSHGYLIPLISGFLVWQKRDQLARLQFSGSWTGWLVCLAGIGLYFLGELSTLYIIIQYALIITLAGVVLAFTGWQGMRILWAPLFFLIFMFPLPAFLYNNVSQQLQIISSELGVAIIRLFGISVSLEGNMIDLGKIKLHVVEACNGLRYLFPLN